MTRTLTRTESWTETGPSCSWCDRNLEAGLTFGDLAAVLVDGKVNVGRAAWNGLVSIRKLWRGSRAFHCCRWWLPRSMIIGSATDSIRVFNGETGQPLRLDNYAKRIIRPALKKTGLKWHGYHSLRRGLATNLHKLGCPAKTAQAILRHANVKTTLDFYIKVGSDTSQKDGKTGSGIQEVRERGKAQDGLIQSFSKRP
jgi:hypothetical protein